MQPVDFQVWGPLAARQKLNCPFAKFRPRHHAHVNRSESEKNLQPKRAKNSDADYINFRQQNLATCTVVHKPGFAALSTLAARGISLDDANGSHARPCGEKI
jgi:hypothetical protein